MIFLVVQSCIKALIIQTEDDVDLNNIARQYLGGAAMKLYAEGLCKFYSTRSKTKFSVLRHTNCIGPYDKLTLGSHVFASVITKTGTENETVEVWGDGNEGRDFLFITDLTDLFAILIRIRRFLLNYYVRAHQN